MYNCLSLQPDLKQRCRWVVKKERRWGRCDESFSKFGSSSLFVATRLTREKVETKVSKKVKKILMIRILVVSLPSALKNCKFFEILIAVFWKRKLQKTAKSFWWFDKGSYLCLPFRNYGFGGAGEEREKVERSLKEWKQQDVNVKHIYGKVTLAKNIDNMTSNFERN